MRCQRSCKGIECRGACENFFIWWICSVTQRWQWRLQKNKAIDIEIHLYAYACWKALKHLLGRPKSLFRFFIAYETREQIFGQPNKKGEFYQMAQWYRIHLPVQETQETWVWSLGWEDPMEKEMTTHSSILVWRIPWTEEPGGQQSMGSQRVRHDWVTEHTLLHVN